MKINANLIVAVFAGLTATVAYGVAEHLEQRRQIRVLEDTIERLQSRLASGEEAISKMRQHQSGRIDSAAITTPAVHIAPVGIGNQDHTDQTSSGSSISSVQQLKDLETGSDGDARPYPERLADFLSGNPSSEQVAIASRSILDKALDRNDLPDGTLRTIYSTQGNMDLRRVVAQVLSQRGDNSLLVSQIAESQAQLNSEEPYVRQQALNQLAKTRSLRAVDAIAPFLQDKDTNVRLQALFALRDTGNYRHANLVEGMLNDPDPSVRALANDVAASLRNFSATARTSYSRSDIEAELPPMANR